MKASGPEPMRAEKAPWEHPVRPLMWTAGPAIAIITVTANALLRKSALSVPVPAAVSRQSVEPSMRIKTVAAAVTNVGKNEKN